MTIPKDALVPYSCPIGHVSDREQGLAYVVCAELVYARHTTVLVACRRHAIRDATWHGDHDEWRTDRRNRYEREDRMNDDVSAVITAAHRAYCRDTGCFDGDDISHPGLAQAIRLSNAEAVVSVLEQTLARSDGCEGGQVASALADAKAEVTRLQEDA